MMKAKLETARLLLRPWSEDDAAALYEYARDPRVGPAAGWPVHTSVENSREIIKTVLCKDGTYAVTVKPEADPVGSAGIFATTAPGISGEYEIGYWIGVPFWGRGFIPEAVNALLDMAFSDMAQERVWCSHFDGNNKSRRVIEKCGFVYQLTAPAPERYGTDRPELYYSITKEEYEKWRAI